MENFTIGDHVRWSRAVLDQNKRNVEGVVTAVYPHDCGVSLFTVYDVEFKFGTTSLYGTQLDSTGMPLPTSMGNGIPSSIS